MNAKKLMSLLTAICLIVSCFAGVVSAEEAELLAISAADVKAAILSADADSAITAVATQKTDYIEVAISSEKLKAHNNANTELGYWAGFALAAPEGADGFKYAFDADGKDIEWAGTSALEPAVVGEDDGVAFYVDVADPDAKLYAMLQWTKEGTAVSVPAIFKMNLDGVKLDEETFTKNDVYIDYLDKKTSTVNFAGSENVSVDFAKLKMEHEVWQPQESTIENEFGKANVCDNPDNPINGENPLAPVYDASSYKVESAEEYDEYYDYYYNVIRIEMDGLKMHNNGNGDAGFWTGFSVKVPEGAKQLRYYKSFGAPPYQNTIDLGNDTEVSFYLSVAENDAWEYTELTWLDENGTELDPTAYYEIDLSGVKLSADDNKFEKANVCDSFPGEEAAPAKAYDTYTVEEKNGTINIDMTGLVLHKNANNSVGYWTGFSVKVPESAKKLAYYKSFGENDHNYQEIELGSDTEVSFYIDVEDDKSNDEWYYDELENEYVILQWFDENGNAISRENYYELDLEDVEVVYPAASRIGKANIVDQSGEKDKLFDNYEATLDHGTIVLKAENLEIHENGEGVEGHWIGFSVEAPEGATHYTFDFGENYTYSPVALEEEQTSVSFYVNASDPDAKDWVGIHWFKSEDRPYHYYGEFFYIDIANVDLADDKPVTVSEAIIADEEGVVTPVYDEGTYDVSEENGKVTIKAEGLKTHYNDNGDLGAWIGAKVSKPDGAEKVKFYFGEDNSRWAWYYDADYVAADEILDVSGDGVSFYFDAFDMTPKNTIMIQWFDENDVAITNRYVYTLDISGVEYEVKAETKMTVEKANIVDQANVNVKPYLGEYDAKLDGNTIVLSADFLREHQNGEGIHGAWIGFKPLVEGAKYVKYVFGYGDWYYDSNVVEAGESFYVDAFDNNYKDELTLQFFDENGKALTNVNTYKIDMEDVQVEDFFFVDYSEISLAGDNARLYNLADSTHWEEVSTADYVYVDTYAENGSVKLSVEGTDESNGGNVFYRNADRKVTLTATPDSGYKFVAWLDDGEEIGDKATIELAIDKCYELEAVFEKGTSSKPAGYGGGGLAAGGDKSNTGADDLGQKDEDKTEGTIVPSAPAFFVDVPAGAWYYDVVKEAYEKGLMNGISETEFAPNQSLTRGMFVTILYRLAGSPAVEAPANFADVPANQYYADAVAWASANGIVNGVSADKFAPNNNITREQMATIIHRYATARGIEAANKAEETYSDSAMISEFAKAAVEWASGAGVLSGNSDGTFAPLRTATRAEAAAIFVRLLGLVK